MTKNKNCWLTFLSKKYNLSLEVKMEINQNTTLGEILKNYENADVVLLGFGMHCFSCPISQMETVKEACDVHNLDCDYVIKKLNEELVPTKK